MASGICSVSYLSKIENEIVEPGEEIIILFCRKLEMTMEELKLQADLIPILRKEYSELYRIIKKRDRVQAEQKREYIREKYSEFSEPEAHLMKGIFDLQYYLFTKENEKNHSIYKKLTSLEEFLNDWTKQYYYRFCGLYQYVSKNFDSALDFFKQAGKFTSSDEIEEVYYHLALTYSQIEYIGDSIYYLKKASDIFMTKMDFEQWINCNLLLGINHRKLKNYPRAKENYYSILEKLEGRTSDSILSKVYHNLGLVYSEEGDSLVAIEYYLKSLEHKQDLDTKLITIHVLAVEYYKINNKEEAVKWFVVGEEYARITNDHEFIIKFKVLSYQLYNKMDSLEFEEYMLDKAIPYFEQSKSYYTLYHLILLLTSYYENTRHYKNAYQLLQKLLIH